MPDIGSALFALLTADAAVRALVEKRVYPVRWPQGAAVPLVVYNQIDRVAAPLHDGPDPMPVLRLQLDLLAPTWTEARQLADAVRQALDFARGSYAGLEIQACNLADEADDFEPDIEWMRIRQDYLVAISA